MLIPTAWSLIFIVNMYTDSDDQFDSSSDEEEDIDEEVLMLVAAAAAAIAVIGAVIAVTPIIVRNLREGRYVCSFLNGGGLWTRTRADALMDHTAGTCKSQTTAGKRNFSKERRRRPW